MNPGPAEEGAKAIGGIVDSLKSQPLALALVVMNIALLALFYVIVRSAEHRHSVIAEQQNKLVELLAHCGRSQP